MKKLRIEQIRSAIDRPLKQKRTLKALGIRKMHQVVIHEDVPAIRGMVNSISHLLKVEEIGE
ncbi:MAG: 50S ribosomal protein L30 [Proteobacteria bacterium]|nr:50S ribosomal protein L30 [Pseudomonadota bacterium]